MLVVIGFAAGIIGGMIGIGGSIIMIPAMAIIFDRSPWAGQHLFQAAAMIVNIAVAIPSALRHRAMGAFRMDLFRWMLPAAIVATIVGVLISNLIPGETLKQVFAVFLVYIVIDEARKILKRHEDHASANARVDAPRGFLVGGVMGLGAGLLGIGGGGLAVPLARVVCRLPVREAIGTVAAVMCVTAVFGATAKVATLESHGADWRVAVLIAAILSPSAVIGGHIGAGLTHRLPLRVVRVVFAVTLLIAAGRMGGLY